MADAPEIRSLKGKLNVLSTVMRLGNEAFRRRGLGGLGLHIVNNSRLLVRFDRSSLVDMRSGRPKLVAVMGMAEADNNTEYGLNVLRLVSELGDLKEKVQVTEEFLQERGASADTLDSLSTLQETASTIFVIPLRDQGEAADTPLFLWIVEFVDVPAAGTDSVLQLLAETYNNALWSSIYSRRRLAQLVAVSGRMFSPMRVFLYVLAIFGLSLFFRIQQNVAADFEVVPEEKETLYAPYDGAIDRVFFRNGAEVKAGDLVMRYNTEELEFRLADAQTSFEEIAAKVDFVRRQAFSDNSHLGEVKLLAIQRDKEKINIEKMKWYLKQSAIRASRAGVLVIDDEERWEGKAVRTGDRLAEIFTPGHLIAAVYLNEKDASVIDTGMGIALYLHTKPEAPLIGKILSVSPKPLLQKNSQYCYVIKIALSNQNLIFGMRGVARVSGPRVSLGYYLFRNLVLWWRKL